MQNGGLGLTGIFDNTGREPDFDDGNIFGIQGGAIAADLLQTEVETTTQTTKDDWNMPVSLNSPLLGFTDAEGNPTGTNRLEVDSSGISRYMRQLRPIGGDRPLLLNGTLSADAFAGDNDEIFSAAIGAKQFLTATHQTVTTTAESDRTMLLPPTLESGNGQAAYSNVGGAIATYPDGSRDFVVQWVSDQGFTEKITNSFDFPVGTTFVPALIAQQPGSESLRLGEFLGMNSHSVTENGLRVIAQDRYPENFSQLSEIEYFVEDTLANGNTAVEDFDGVRRAGTVDFNDARLSLLSETPMVEVSSRIANPFGFYVGGNVGVGVGNRLERDRTIETITETRGSGRFNLDANGMLQLASLEREAPVSFSTVSESTSSEFDFSPVRTEAVLGAVLNYGGTPWTESASNIRAELYGGTDSGVRAELRQRVGVGSAIAAVKLDHRFDDGDTSAIAALSLGF